MPAVTAIMIDSREPDNIKNLKFAGIPTTVAYLETGDILAVTDDGHELVIERKTPDDLLGTLKDDRLFPQLARMVAKRQEQQLAGMPVTSWAYLVITEPLRSDPNTGKVVTQRGITGWSFAAVMGMILSIQEMGVFVIFANGADDYQECILRIGRRTRKPEMVLLPPRTPNILGPKATFLASLPHVGVEKVQEILAWSGDNLAHALSGLTDLTIKAPLPMSYRKEIKDLFGLEDNQSLEIYQKES